MPLRLIEARLPDADPSDVEGWLEDATLVDQWYVDEGGEVLSLRILAGAAETETIADLLRDARGSREGFRLILLAVEATVPTPEEPEEEDETAEGEESEPSPPSRISREELYEDVQDSSRLTPVYLVMVALSTLVASVGLIRGDVAIVIGAMVIAPLLGPNIALSLAATLGDLDLAKRSTRAIAAGVGTAAVLSLLLGWGLEIDPTVPDIADRTRAGLGDIALALSAGAAGSLAFTGGVPAAVVGVMVAVALLPPLVVAGLLAGSGDLGGAGGAMVLLATNVACLNLAAIGTFWVQRVQPRTWWEADRARTALRWAVASWLLLLAALVLLILFGDVGVEVR